MWVVLVAWVRTTVVRAGRMVDIVFGILRKVLGHEGLATALASHDVLRQAVIDGGLRGCGNPIALTAACRFLRTASRDYKHTNEVRRCILRETRLMALLMPFATNCAWSRRSL